MRLGWGGQGVFGLAFVVEVVVGYNSIMHKTQPQKLTFLTFHSFLVDPIPKPQPPPLTQTLIVLARFNTMIKEFSTTMHIWFIVLIFSEYIHVKIIIIYPKKYIFGQKKKRLRKIKHIFKIKRVLIKEMSLLLLFQVF
jgi:hypothetical protein